MDEPDGFKVKASVQSRRRNKDTHYALNIDPGGRRVV